MQPVTDVLAARVVLDSLLAWGQAGRNAVMDVLDGMDRPRRGAHYPRQALAFGGGRWRAYYHSHPEGQPPPSTATFTCSSRRRRRVGATAPGRTSPRCPSIPGGSRCAGSPSTPG